MTEHSLAYYMGWATFWTLLFIYSCLSKDAFSAAVAGGFATYHAFAALDRSSIKE